LARRPTELGALVSASVEALREAPATRQGTIDSRLGACEAVVDAARMAQVVSNLVGNAIKFSPPGRQVEVQLVERDEQFELTVRDHGRGFTAETAGHLFEPFWQAESGSSHRSSGLGLGLPIVRRIVELHGGSIVCHSDGADRGATFHVVAPKHASQEPEAIPASLQRHSADYPSLAGIDLLFR